MDINESSSSESIETVDSYFTHFEASAEEEINIFDLVQQSDAESVDEELSEYDRTQLMHSVYQLSAEVPDVDDVSEDIPITKDSSKLPKRKPIVFTVADIAKDKGRFVNPLSGLLRESRYKLRTAKTEESPEVSEDSEEEKAVASSKGLRLAVSRESFLQTNILDEDKKGKDDSLHENFEAFFKLEPKIETVKQEEIDWKALFREEETKLVKNQTLTFLNEIIDKAVQFSEHLSPEKFLQKNLDKRKLMTELANTLSILQSVSNTNTLLNSQVVKHFRRKQSFRNITADNANTLLQEQHKLETAKEHLDQALAKEKKLKEVSTELQDQLNRQHKQLRQKAENQIQIFENQVKKHLCRKESSKINTIIERLLSMMSKCRQEISEVRLSLFLQQHNEATFKDQINKLDHLGNGLQMKSLTILQAENHKLEKKIEERNGDLDKLSTRCHKSVHRLAHYKEKQQMFRNTIDIQKTMFHYLEFDRHSIREHLHSLNLQHNHILREMKTLRIQSGILDKPDLMLDYDNTVRIVSEKKEMVEYLRRTLATTQAKIDQLTAQCKRKVFYFH